LAKPSGHQGRRRKRAIERALSRLPEKRKAETGREQIRRALASREGKTRRVIALEKALTRYLAWIGEPDRTIAEIIDVFNLKDDPRRADESDYKLRDDPVERELREALKRALRRSVAKAPGRSAPLGKRALRRYFENSQREVWKRR
jgi:hypothetical protein